MENFTPPPQICTPQKITPLQNILIQVIRANFTFWKILIFLSDLNSKIFTPGVKFFEFDNKYIIRCLLLKYRLIFLLVFLYLTRLKARQILSRLVKNISLYFKRRHLIIYKYFWGHYVINSWLDESCSTHEAISRKHVKPFIKLTGWYLK